MLLHVKMADLLMELRAKILERGPNGIQDISRTFRNMDVDHSNWLSLKEFGDGLKDFGLSFPESSVEELFSYIDKDGQHGILFDEFLEALRPPMSQTRISIINEAFAKFDKTGDGVITLEDLKGVYSVKHHPKYLNGEMTEDQILRTFLDVFDQGVKDGTVTKEEFTNYYSGVGANIDTDEEFVKMMTTAWKI
ncbi:calcyphosin-like protein isoform X3 [Mytilus californianus]|uniref:calcyphosin-like protein isoform X3 n=1 Tax=Mytilus californianus TaxID=6549 RepID=UPI0022455742|nr:calcyphosin-like protein isoform X3 [Mytilus californianus]